MNPAFAAQRLERQRLRVFHSLPALAFICACLPILFIAMTLEMALDAIRSEDRRWRRLVGLLRIHHFPPWQRRVAFFRRPGVTRRGGSLQKSGPFKKIEDRIEILELVHSSAVS